MKSSFGDFGFAVCELPWPDKKFKEPAKRDWPGEHGEDVYVPADGLKMEAYDLEAEFLYNGNVNSAYPAYRTFCNYLSGANGGGAELMVYDPYWRKGRTSAHILEITDLEPSRSNVDETLAFKAKFRVADPMTEVVTLYDTNGELKGLGTL